MNEYAVDAGMLLGLVLPNQHDQSIEQFLNQLQAGRVRLLAPDIIFSECAALALDLLKSKQLSADEAKSLVELVKHAPVQVVASTQLLSVSLHIARSLDIAIAQALYLATAIRADARLLTMNEEFYALVQGSQWADSSLHISRYAP